MPQPIHTTPPPAGIVQENLVARVYALKHRQSKFSLFPAYLGLVGVLMAYSVNEAFVWPYATLLIVILGIHDLAKARSREQLDLLEKLAVALEKQQIASPSSTDH